MATKEDLKEQAQTVNNNTDGDVEILDENSNIYIRIHDRWHWPIQADNLIRNDGWLVSLRACDNEYLEIYHSYSPYSP
jgi:hypothetical protein